MGAMCLHRTKMSFFNLFRIKEVDGMIVAFD